MGENREEGRRKREEGRRVLVYTAFGMRDLKKVLLFKTFHRNDITFVP